MVRLWKRDGPFLLLPRALCPVGEDDRRVLGALAEFKSTIKPKNDEQHRVILEASNLLDDGESFQIQAPTGFGKTVMGLDLIADVGRKALVVVPKEDLLEEWTGQARKFLDLRPKDVGIIQGDRCRVEGCKIVVGMLHSLAIPGRYPPTTWQHFGLVIWDEVHKVPAPTFSYTASLFPALRRVGLSATPERWDGKEIIAQAHIGPVRVSTDAADVDFRVARYQSPWRCPRRPVMDDETGQTTLEPIPHEAGRCGHIINMLARHAGRNELITRMVLGGYRKNRRVVVFSDRKNQLEVLRAAAMMGGAKEDDTAMYVSGIGKGARAEAVRRPLIFATYGMMNLGTNIPWLDACVLATPRADVEQTVGRIRREWPDKPEPVVVDIVDDTSPVLLRYAATRAQFYARVGAKVVDY